MNKFRQDLTVVALGAVILMYWAFQNTYPLVYSDTGTYIRSWIENWLPVDRPIYYSWFIRHFSLKTSLWYVVFAQALILSYLIFLLLNYFFDQDKIYGYFIIVVFLLSILTGISFNVSMLTPDIFTAYLFLCLCLLAYGKNISSINRIILSLLFIFSIITHNAHIYILFIFFFVLSLLSLFRNKLKMDLQIKKFSYILLLFLISLVLVPCLNYQVGGKFMHSEVSHIFMMHKLHDDDILVKYLNENCAQKKYSICSYKDKLPWNLMWDSRSPIMAVDDWNKNKDENEKIIVDILTTYKYAKLFFVKSIHQTFKQFFHFNTGDAPVVDELLNPPLSAIRDHYSTEIREFLSAKQCNKKISFETINYTQNLLVYISLMIILLSFYTSNFSMAPQMKNSLVVLFIYLFANAFVCATFSNVLERYQSRVVWLLPLFASILIIQKLSAFGENKNINEVKKLLVS